MQEVNIDTLVGPTHLYGGLSSGNLASTIHKLKESRPKQAALEGLEKMHLLHTLGVPQLVLPPQPRSDLLFLQSLGFSGTEQQVLEQAYTQDPTLLFQAASSSSMWAANAATITPSCDTTDGKLHITIANLAANTHRSLEPPFSYWIFKQLFQNEALFTLHPPLPSTYELFDEGAANHIRFCADDSFVHLFAWGRSREQPLPTKRFTARQTLQASQAIVRRHTLREHHVVFAETNPRAIDLGVFHNDVIATGHEAFFFVHEDAYVDTKSTCKELQQICPIEIYMVKRRALSIEEAVKSYLFNSQIVTTKQGIAMLCPLEVKKCPKALRIANKLLDGHINSLHFVPLRQSMLNGGGPACLRLRVLMNTLEWRAINQSFVLTPKLYTALRGCIEQHYPDRLSLKDLLDPEVRFRIKLCYEQLFSHLNIIN